MRGKIGTGKELTNISMENFSQLIKDLPQDKDALMLGYLAMIAQHTALIADRLMDLVISEKERR